MNEHWASFPYLKFTITIFQADGVWWARARLAQKDMGGDRAVTGGPWRSQAEARSAAESFCQLGRAGTPTADPEPAPS